MCTRNVSGVYRKLYVVVFFSLVFVILRLACSMGGNSQKCVTFFNVFHEFKCTVVFSSSTFRRYIICGRLVLV